MVLVGSGYSPSAVASGAECQLKDKMGSDELDHSFFILFFVAKTKVLSAFLKIFLVARIFFLKQAQSSSPFYIKYRKIWPKILGCYNVKNHLTPIVFCRGLVLWWCCGLGWVWLISIGCSIGS